MGVKPTTTTSTRPATRPSPDPLETVLAEVNCTAAKFEDFVEWLHATTGANIHVNWKALETAGTDNTAPVTLHVQNLPAKRVLSLALEEVTGTAELGYRWSEGVVVISSRHDLDRAMTTQVYDIRDLMAESFLTSQRLASSAPATQPITPSPAISGGLSGPRLSPADFGVGTEMERGSHLIDIILESVEPESWRKNGGPGAIRYFAGLLIITQQEENHEKVEALLRKLRGQD